jgi:hypothetical protein
MTKKQKDQKAQDLIELECRLVDLAQGAAGGCAVEDGQDECSAGIAYSMGIPEWIRFVQAVQRTFRESTGASEAPAMKVAFELWNLPRFAERFDVAAEHLYDCGARA